ncbi:hypothetical protein CAOG_009623 [Capsaspora owczarzaki ATCC 30864]|uniref:HECT-type E3 ubiquitin transferase n=2 Tax=Capsaspora owczarzaki (strain ATCC 30864) TaxID=595528 RepID=A0A0D2X260_CAPO3|nr:hypothetical protein CAOG_009623 [Capsaspora owczarzaki ATCC 30864]
MLFEAFIAAHLHLNKDASSAAGGSTGPSAAGSPKRPANDTDFSSANRSSGGLRQSVLLAATREPHLYGAMVPFKQRIAHFTPDARVRDLVRDLSTTFNDVLRRGGHFALGIFHDSPVDKHLTFRPFPRLSAFPLFFPELLTVDSKRLWIRAYKADLYAFHLRASNMNANGTTTAAAGGADAVRGGGRVRGLGLPGVPTPGGGAGVTTASASSSSTAATTAAAAAHTAAQAAGSTATATDPLTLVRALAGSSSSYSRALQQAMTIAATAASNTSSASSSADTEPRPGPHLTVRSATAAAVPAAATAASLLEPADDNADGLEAHDDLVRLQRMGRQVDFGGVSERAGASPHPFSQSLSQSLSPVPSQSQSQPMSIHPFAMGSPTPATPPAPVAPALNTNADGVVAAAASSSSSMSSSMTAAPFTTAAAASNMGQRTVLPAPRSSSPSAFRATLMEVRAAALASNEPPLRRGPGRGAWPRPWLSTAVASQALASTGPGTPIHSMPMLITSLPSPMIVGGGDTPGPPSPAAAAGPAGPNFIIPIDGVHTPSPPQPPRGAGATLHPSTFDPFAAAGDAASSTVAVAGTPAADNSVRADDGGGAAATPRISLLQTPNAPSFDVFSHVMSAFTRAWDSRVAAQLSSTAMNEHHSIPGSTAVARGPARTRNGDSMSAEVGTLSSSASSESASSNHSSDSNNNNNNASAAVPGQGHATNGHGNGPTGPTGPTVTASAVLVGPGTTSDGRETMHVQVLPGSNALASAAAAAVMQGLTHGTAVVVNGRDADVRGLAQLAAALRNQRGEPQEGPGRATPTPTAVAAMAVNVTPGNLARVVPPRAYLHIDRRRPLESAFRSLLMTDRWATLGLPGALHVEFIGESGAGPGVLREWCTVMTEAFLDPRQGLFVTYDKGLTYHLAPAFDGDDELMVDEVVPDPSLPVAASSTNITATPMDTTTSAATTTTATTAAAVPPPATLPTTTTAATTTTTTTTTTTSTTTAQDAPPSSAPEQQAAATDSSTSPPRPITKLDLCELAGRFLGLSILLGVSLPMRLTRPLLQLLLVADNTPRPWRISDLAYFDREFYESHLLYVLHNNVEGLDLNFTHTVELPAPRAESVPAVDSAARALAEAARHSHQPLLDDTVPKPDSAAADDAVVAMVMDGGDSASAVVDVPLSRGKRGLSTLLESDAQIEHPLDAILWKAAADAAAAAAPDSSSTANKRARTLVDVEIIPNGADLVVTAENKLEYIRHLAEFRVLNGVESRVRSLRNGFLFLLPLTQDPVLARLGLTATELDLLLSGEPTIDVNEWKACTGYSTTMTPSSPLVQWFWEVVETMSQAERAQLLLFWTGFSRLPTGGMGSLTQASEPFALMMNSRRLPFTITQAGSPDRLPSSSTCTLYLSLPPYESKEALRSKLMAAIQQCRGFAFR